MYMKFSDRATHAKSQYALERVLLAQKSIPVLNGAFRLLRVPPRAIHKTAVRLEPPAMNVILSSVWNYFILRCAWVRIHKHVVHLSRLHRSAAAIFGPSTDMSSSCIVFPSPSQFLTGTRDTIRYEQRHAEAALPVSRILSSSGPSTECASNRVDTMSPGGHKMLSAMEVSSNLDKKSYTFPSPKKEHSQFLVSRAQNRNSAGTSNEPQLRNYQEVITHRASKPPPSQRRCHLLIVDRYVKQLRQLLLFTIAVPRRHDTNSDTKKPSSRACLRNDTSHPHPASQRAHLTSRAVAICTRNARTAIPSVPSTDEP
ncbi:hypothetical protein A0H81_07231 [Grifola frondosa]|uniref:Uncharacterized protein n=1 Tax=Grifola frondosa TaxID=5627 RepID=A0A1C7M8Z9_GRIFR|nr:hypothetical protein A0H81_07231 [Grifola frondosa]